MIWDLLEYGAFFATAWVCLFNFFLSFIRMPWNRWRGRDVRWSSGVPLFGSAFLLWFAIWHSDSPIWFWSSIAIALLDTGGLHWFASTMFWQEVIRARLTGR